MTLYEGFGCTGTELDNGITNSDGNVVFSGLEAGNYSVKETLKDGWTNTTPLCVDVTLAAGGDETAEFGNQPHCVASIEGYKFANMCCGNGLVCIICN